MPIAGFAGTCYPSTAACLYASKHNRFVNFTHVSSNPQEMAKLVPDTNLMDDLATGNVPNYAFLAPDQCHDEHGIEASSGKITRYRLNRGGDRQGNRALYLLAVGRMGRDPADKSLRRAPDGRGADQARNHPLPQALHCS